MNRAVLVLAAVGSLSFVSCGGYSSSYKKPPSGLTTRVLVSQDVSSSFTLAGLVIIDAQKDVQARASEISAGNTPGLMALSPTRATLLTFDSSNNSVQVVDTRTESNIGRLQLLGPTSSMVIPATTTTGYAAVPSASINLLPTPGAVQVMNLSTGSAITIGVPNAQTVVSNPNGTQLLVFSNDSNSVSVISPLLAVGPVDQGCDSPQASPVCTVVPGFDHPVYGVISGSVAYILNCGQECTGTGSGGKGASVQALHLTNPPTVDSPIPVDGATIGFLSGSNLYVAGNSPSNNACSGQTTAATTCGRLNVLDVGSMTVTNSVVITDGYHDRVDLSLNGQLFIGSHNCTNVGNINNPQGEVRGCLSIFDTTKSGNSAAVIPSDNGDVTGLQSFSTRNVEYVVEGGNLRIYDTTKNALQKTQVKIVGEVIDVKAVDFF